MSEQITNIADTFFQRESKEHLSILLIRLNAEEKKNPPHQSSPIHRKSYLYKRHIKRILCSVSLHCFWSLMFMSRAHSKSLFAPGTVSSVFLVVSHSQANAFHIFSAVAIKEPATSMSIGILP